MTSLRGVLPDGPDAYRDAPFPEQHNRRRVRWCFSCDTAPTERCERDHDVARIWTCDACGEIPASCYDCTRLCG